MQTRTSSTWQEVCCKPDSSRGHVPPQAEVEQQVARHQGDSASPQPPTIHRHCQHASLALLLDTVESCWQFSKASKTGLVVKGLLTQVAASNLRTADTPVVMQNRSTAVVGHLAFRQQL